MFKNIIQEIKNNKELFKYLANKLYAFFNVIERNDLIKIIGDSKTIYRVVDVYDTGAIDMVCDTDPQPMRERLSRPAQLYKKFFKGQSNYRSEKHDKGWRMFPGGFYNFTTKEVIQRKG